MNKNDVIEAVSLRYFGEAAASRDLAPLADVVAETLAALEAAGMVIVPREATHKMIGEGQGAALMAPSGLASIEAIYRAMHAASPFAAAMGEG